MKIVFVIDSWNKGNGCIVVTHTLPKGEKIGPLIMKRVAEQV